MEVADYKLITLFLFTVGLQAVQLQAQSTAVQSQPTCNVTALNVCTQAFAPTNYQFQSAQINASTIAAACSLYNTTVNCVANSANCSDTDPTVIFNWLGDKQAIGYRCGDGKQAYLQAQPCLGNGTFISQFLQQCNPAMLQTQSPSNSSSNPVIVCRDYYIQQNCVQTLAKQTCGMGAAQFMKTVLSKLLGPAVQARNQTCIVSGAVPGAMWLTNIYLIIVTLFVALNAGRILSSSQ
jgi:hypothetical protein